MCSKLRFWRQHIEQLGYALFLRLLRLSQVLACLLSFHWTSIPVFRIGGPCWISHVISFSLLAEDNHAHTTNLRRCSNSHTSTLCFACFPVTVFCTALLVQMRQHTVNPTNETAPCKCCDSHTLDEILVNLVCIRYATNSRAHSEASCISWCLLLKRPLLVPLGLWMSFLFC